MKSALIAALLAATATAHAAGSTRANNDAAIPVLKVALKQARGTAAAPGRWQGSFAPTTRANFTGVQVDEDGSAHAAADRLMHHASISSTDPRLGRLAERLMRGTRVTPHIFTTPAGKNGAVVMMLEGAQGQAIGDVVPFGPFELEVTNEGTLARPVLHFMTLTSEAQVTGGPRTSLSVTRVEWDPKAPGGVPTATPPTFAAALRDLRQIQAPPTPAP